MFSSENGKKKNSILFLFSVLYSVHITPYVELYGERERCVCLPRCFHLISSKTKNLLPNMWMKCKQKEPIRAHIFSYGTFIRQRKMTIGNNLRFKIYQLIDLLEKKEFNHRKKNGIEFLGFHFFSSPRSFGNEWIYYSNYDLHWNKWMNTKYSYDAHIKM